MRLQALAAPEEDSSPAPPFRRWTPSWRFPTARPSTRRPIRIIRSQPHHLGARRRRCRRRSRHARGQEEAGRRLDVHLRVGHGTPRRQALLARAGRRSDRSDCGRCTCFDAPPVTSAPLLSPFRLRRRSLTPSLACTAAPSAAPSPLAAASARAAGGWRRSRSPRRARRECGNAPGKTDPCDEPELHGLCGDCRWRASGGEQHALAAAPAAKWDPFAEGRADGHLLPRDGRCHGRPPQFR